jgi:TPP-dependent pyruvate/acetoin dehydrogenase alpha subunit
MLIEQKLFTKKELDAVDQAVSDELAKAVEFARTSPLPQPADALQDLWV